MYHFVAAARMLEDGDRLLIIPTAFVSTNLALGFASLFEKLDVFWAAGGKLPAEVEVDFPLSISD